MPAGVITHIHHGEMESEHIDEPNDVLQLAVDNARKILFAQRGFNDTQVIQQLCCVQVSARLTIPTGGQTLTHQRQ